MSLFPLARGYDGSDDTSFVLPNRTLACSRCFQLLPPIPAFTPALQI